LCIREAYSNHGPCNGFYPPPHSVKKLLTPIVGRLFVKTKKKFKTQFKKFKTQFGKKSLFNLYKSASESMGFHLVFKAYAYVRESGNRQRGSSFSAETKRRNTTRLINKGTVKRYGTLGVAKFITKKKNKQNESISIPRAAVSYG
jgi:hypothetical protein